MARAFHMLYIYRVSDLSADSTSLYRAPFVDRKLLLEPRQPLCAAVSSAHWKILLAPVELRALDLVMVYFSSSDCENDSCLACSVFVELDALEIAQRIEICASSRTPRLSCDVD